MDTYLYAIEGMMKQNGKWFYLKEREYTISLFDVKYSRELNEVVSYFEKTINNFAIMFIKSSSNLFKNNKECKFLILRSIEYLITSLSLIRQRAIIESYCIIRLALETSATAFHISKDNKQLDLFKKGNYKSTKAIKYATKYIPQFGKIWGALSTAAVHITPFHGIIEYYEDGNIYEYGEINFGKRELDDFQDKRFLLLMKIACSIVHRFYELIYYKKAKIKGTNGYYQEESGLFLLGKKTEDIINDLLIEFENQSA